MSKRKEKTISDHAVVRYMERKYGCDFGPVREEMTSPGLIKAIKAAAKAYRHHGFRFVIKNTQVVTVIGGNS